MAFLVFPDPPTSPVTLLPGMESASATIGELAAPDPATGVEAMYITIVQLGAAGSCAAPANASPTVVLQVADSTEVLVTGPVPLVIGASGTAATIFAAGQQMTARMRALDDGVFRVRIAFPDGVTGSSWQMRIRNNDPVSPQLRYTWVVADASAESEQPWIEAPTTPATGPLEVLINRFQDLTIPVQNLGTGSLAIADTPIGGGFSIKTIPPPIPPNGCANLVLTYAAAAASEEVSVVYDIESNDSTALAIAGHNRQIALAAKSIMFEIGFVLDASGSMASRPNGTPTGVIEEQRWGKLRTAGGVFLDSLKNFGTAAGTFGIAVFPDVTQGFPPASSAGEVLGRIGIDAGSIADAKDKLRELGPDGGTPMGDGIEAGLGGSGFSGFFAEGPAERAVNRRWMVLMSDGAHNAGPPQPEAFTGAGPLSFAGKRVRAFTVAYGEPGAWEVRPEQLNLIATASGGVAQDAGVDDAGLDLVKAFELALTTGLNLVSIADPRHVLTGEAYVHRHTVLVTPFDRTVSFIVTWGSIDLEWRPRVWLLTPNGELLDQDTATGEPGVTVDEGERYIMFACDESYLQGGVLPRYGPWLLFVADDNLAGTALEEPYSYNVIVDSRLKLAVTFDRARYAAGDPIGVAAALTVDGAPIGDARVLLHLTAPRQSAANWLAAQEVPPGHVAEAEAVLAETSRDRASRLRAKALAAAGFKFENMTFDPLNLTDAIPMTYDGQRGCYVAQAPGTTVPGTYDFFISVLGATADGTLYRREARVQHRLEARPGPYPEVSLLDAVFHAANEIEATLRVWPWDRFRNVVMVDPEYPVMADPEEGGSETDQTIRVEVAGAEKDGPLVSNLDGSYSQKVRYRRDIPSSPMIDVVVYDEPIVEQLPLPTPLTHIFANDVVDFVEGAEAKEVENAHANPDDAARGEFPFDGDTFVALGAGGVLALGNKDGATILAGSPDDVVVFVHPTAELRPYVVEAQSVHGFGEWVRIGYSWGTTQGFTLVELLDEARAVRIRDLSDRVYDDDLNPLDAPGVNILGVGFRNVS